MDAKAVMKEFETFRDWVLLTRERGADYRDYKNAFYKSKYHLNHSFVDDGEKEPCLIVHDVDDEEYYYLISDDKVCYESVDGRDLSIFTKEQFVMLYGDFEYFSPIQVMRQGYITLPKETLLDDGPLDVINKIIASPLPVIHDMRAGVCIFADVETGLTVRILTIGRLCRESMKRKELGLRSYPFKRNKSNDDSLVIQVYGNRKNIEKSKIARYTIDAVNRVLNDLDANGIIQLDKIQRDWIDIKFPVYF